MKVASNTSCCAIQGVLHGVGVGLRVQIGRIPLWVGLYHFRLNPIRVGLGERATWPYISPPYKPLHCELDRLDYDKTKTLAF